VKTEMTTALVGLLVENVKPTQTGCFQTAKLVATHVKVMLPLLEMLICSQLTP